MIEIDHIIVNANIHTSNPDHPHATALAIIGERIVAIGDDTMIRGITTRTTHITNADGRTILPGLTDAHVHWEGYARSRKSVNVWEVPTKAEALRRVAARIQGLPPDSWIFGRGWLQDLWEGKAFPTRYDLDEVAPQHPVYLAAKSGHAAWVNSRALDLANITAYTPDPHGGTIVRLPNGEPSGILLEEALELVRQIIPSPTPEETAEWMLEAQEEVLKLGLTGIHDFDNPSCLVALQILRERGDLGLRVVKQINKDWLAPAIALGIRSNFGDDWLRFGGLKLFADGALGPRTALMIQPYEGEPHNYGVAVTDREEMQELVSKASENGLLSTIHAIGDRAVHDVLDIFEFVRHEESARGTDPTELRHRIEHVQIIHPHDVGRLAELNVIASMQPIHMIGDYVMADAYWGARAEYSYAWRKQLNAGAVLAFGSDAPIESLDPRLGIHAAVTRHRPDGAPSSEGWYPQERLTLREAIRAYTQAPAYAAGMDDRLGMLAPNHLADLIVLDQDIFDIEPDAIPTMNIMGTMVGGVWRYRNF